MMKHKQPLNLNVVREILAVIERDLTEKSDNVKNVILENKTFANRDGRFVMENNIDYARGGQGGG